MSLKIFKALGSHESEKGAHFRDQRSREGILQWGLNLKELLLKQGV